MQAVTLSRFEGLVTCVCMRVLDDQYLIVVCQLLSSMYVSLGIDDNVLMPIHGDDLGIAVGFAAVIDEASKTTLNANSSPKQMER